MEIENQTDYPVWNQTLINQEIIKAAPSIRPCMTLSFVVFTVLMGPICVFGLFGNIVSILALRYDKQHMVAALLLQALAVADSCLILPSFVALAISHGLLPFIGRYEDSFLMLPYLFKYLNPIAYMALTQTILTTCLLAINRYIAVCKVFLSWKLCTMRRTRIQILVITAFSILFNIPRFFQNDIVQIGNVTRRVPTSIGGNSVFAMVYTNALFTILIFILPLVLLVFINAKVIYVIKSAWKSRRRMSNSKDKPQRISENNITKVMVVIICIFVACHAPDRVLQIIALFKVKDHGCALTLFHAICNFLVVLNSSCNFLIYCLLRRRFKEVVLGLFCGCFSRRYRLQRMFSTMEPKDSRNMSLRPEANTRSRSEGTIDFQSEDSEL